MGWKDLFSRKDIDEGVAEIESRRDDEKKLRREGKTKEADELKKGTDEDEQLLRQTIKNIGKENQQERRQGRGNSGEQKNKHALPRAATRNNYEPGVRTFSTKSGRCM
jgi:hypothetical protein